MAAKNLPLLAMVALDAPQLPPLRQLVEAFARRGFVPEAVAGLEEREATVVFPVGDGRMAISLVPTPIAWERLEGPCRCAWWWPEAAERMQAHRAHAIVALADHSGSSLERHLLLTQLAAVVAATSSAAGVFWSAGAVVHAPAAFVALANVVSAEEVLPELWINLRVAENADQTRCLFTTGLEAFGQREIEIPSSQRSAEEIVQFAYRVIQYLLVSGASLQDGETIGRSDEEKIEVHYGPSMLDSDRQVMTLAFA